MLIRLHLFLFLTGVLSISFAESTMCKLICIPSGSFEMGSTNGQQDETPIHRITIDSFYLGITEVTIWEYLQCVHAGACRMPYWWNKRFFPEKADERSGSDWLNLPVTGVSYYDAVSFCKWLGTGYRLPTEAEWEYAARGGTTTNFFWGDTFDSASIFAVVDNKLSPVKSLRSNAFGLYDMTGNAWEWCQDRYNPGYYMTSISSNPAGPADSVKFPYHVVRGGNWNEYPWNLRSANRNFGEPFRRFDGVGFRVCRSISHQ